MDELSLPIDIHTNKLLDWLVSRRHCNKDWQPSLMVIRDKIKHAIQDMPPHEEITKLLIGSYIDYYHCKRIVEILKETEADSKNIFGFYSSQRMKDWQEIIKLYEKDNVYLAEAAQILIRNVNYEIPSIKKQLTKLQQNSDEFEKSANELVKQSNVYKHDYANAAQKLGIQGDDIKKELLNQLDELPEKLIHIFKHLNKLKPIRNYYLLFLEFTLNRKVDELVVLNYLLQNGNTTYFQYRTGQVPDIIEEAKSCVTITDSQSGNGNSHIDYGGIDFGSDETASSESPLNGDFVHVEREDLTQCQENNEINWDIKVEDVEPAETIISNPDERVARGQDAQTVLEVTITRNLLINELKELEGFFEQRLFEMNSEDDVISSNQFQSAPAELQLTSVDVIASMLAQIKEILEMLTNSKMKVLYYMKDSPKYIDNVIEKLSHYMMLSKKALEKSKSMEDKRISCLEEYSNLEPKVPLLIQQTKEIQKKIEDDISKRYKNRPVNIMGGVQML